MSTCFTGLRRLSTRRASLKFRTGMSTCACTSASLPTIRKARTSRLFSHGERHSFRHAHGTSSDATALDRLDAQAEALRFDKIAVQQDEVPRRLIKLKSPFLRGLVGAGGIDASATDAYAVDAVVRSDRVFILFSG